MITGAAYAVISPFHSSQDIMIALNAMQSGVPVIATQSSAIKEVAADAAVYAEEGSIKDMGERMMQLYIDENFRSGLIAKGKATAETFTSEKATELLWQSIMKVL
jgi:glycosyltransferase involved in cell wall biosynthesis